MFPSDLARHLEVERVWLRGHEGLESIAILNNNHSNGNNNNKDNNNLYFSSEYILNQECEGAEYT